MGMKEEHAEVGNDVRRNDGCRKEVEKNGERVGGRWNWRYGVRC